MYWLRTLTACSTLLLASCTIYTRGTVTTTVDARYGAPTYVTVDAPPPPLQEAVVMGAKPSPGSVWVSGYWHWQGQWAWRAGHWETPRAGYEWEPPVCVATVDGRYQYHPGYWRQQSAQPPSVYRASGTIRVHVIPPGQQPRVNRVVVTAAAPRPTTTVRVRATAATGRSANVQVAPVTATVQPPAATATVRAQPATATATVRTQPSATTTVRAQPATATTTVRAQPATATTTVRANPSAMATVRTQPARATATTTVRPGRTATTAPASAMATTTVRPGRTATTAPASAMATTTVRPGRTATTNPASAMAVNTVRPGRTATTAPASAMANTAIRTQPGAAMVSGTRVTTNMGPTVMAGGNANVSASPTVNVRVQCRPAVASAPRNGRVVLRGRNLTQVSSVTVGGRNAPIVRKTDRELTATMPGNNGGAVRIGVTGGATQSCGSVRIVGTGMASAAVMASRGR